MKNSHMYFREFFFNKKKMEHLFYIKFYFQGVLLFVLLDSYINSEMIGLYACMSFQLSMHNFPSLKLNS